MSEVTISVTNVPVEQPSGRIIVDYNSETKTGVFVSAAPTVEGSDGQGSDGQGSSSGGRRQRRSRRKGGSKKQKKRKGSKKKMGW